MQLTFIRHLSHIGDNTSSQLFLISSPPLFMTSAKNVDGPTKHQYEVKIKLSLRGFQQKAFFLVLVGEGGVNALRLSDCSEDKT